MGDGLGPIRRRSHFRTLKSKVQTGHRLAVCRERELAPTGTQVIPPGQSIHEGGRHKWLTRNCAEATLEAGVADDEDAIGEIDKGGGHRRIGACGNHPSSMLFVWITAA